MLEKIKSIFFIKILFFHIEEREKLKLVKYNKTLQYTIGLNLINYKILSEKYIQFDTKRKGKEYNYYDELVFEGEYLNGKRNGKGKEYVYNELVFEGEYLNGKIWNGILIKKET